MYTCARITSIRTSRIRRFDAHLFVRQTHAHMHTVLDPIHPLNYKTCFTGREGGRSAGRSVFPVALVFRNFASAHMEAV